MILAPRKHLFATNLIFFCLIFVLQKLIKLFCIIERKACSSDGNCTSPQRCCNLNNNSINQKNNKNNIHHNNNNKNNNNSSGSGTSNGRSNAINNNNNRKQQGRTTRPAATDHAVNGCVHVNTTMRRNPLKRIAEVDEETETEMMVAAAAAAAMNAGYRIASNSQSNSYNGGVGGGGGVGVDVCMLAGMPRRSMLLRMFGYGEGHYQLFVEDKQRQKEPSKACLNAAVAELKLNPN